MLGVPLRFLFQPALKAPIHAPATPAEIRGWSTSSFGTAVDTSPLELRDLSDHLGRCRRSSDALFPALCFSDSVDSFLAPRVMTTLVVIALIASAAVAAI